MNRFIGDQPWSRITELAKQHKGAHVAVPYLHEGASQMLPLTRGDVLKVNIMSAQVNPRELQEYQHKGVNLYTAPLLHAKVFVFGNRAVVGSTNVSSTSENLLREAVVESTDKAVVAAARRFIEELDCERITDGWIRRCREIYRKPSGFGRRGGSSVAQDADRWCRQVMRLVAPGKVKHDGLNRYYISLDRKAVARASLRVDQNEDGEAIFLLSLHPGDSPRQAKALYATTNVSMILGLKRSHWDLYPNFHFGFAAKGFCWIETPMRIREYIRFWTAERLPIQTVTRPSTRDKRRFRLFFGKLRRLNLISRSDVPSLEDTFTNTGRTSVQIRPGLTFQFAWPHVGHLPNARWFAGRLRAKINEALRACVQSPI